MSGENVVCLNYLGADTEPTKLHFTEPIQIGSRANKSILGISDNKCFV